MLNSVNYDQLLCWSASSVILLFTSVQIRVLRPPNYAAPAVVVLLAMLIGGLLYMRRNNLDFLYNRTSWGLICLVGCFDVSEWTRMDSNRKVSLLVSSLPIGDTKS